MNHDFVRDGNVWASLSDLTSAEMALLDFNAAHSIDDRGGTYALEEDMVIGGGVDITWDFELPVNFSEDVDVIAPLYVSGTTTIDALLNVLDDATFEAATFNQDAEFEGDVYLNGTAMLVQSQAVFFDDATFQGPVTFEDPATFESDGIFEGDVYLNGTAALIQSQVTHFGAVTFRGVTQTSHAGYIAARRVRRQVAGADANASYAPVTYDHVYVASGLTSPHDYTIDDTGAANGDRIRFSTQDATHAVTIKTPGGVTISSIRNAAGFFVAQDFERISGVWRSVMRAPFDA